MKRPLLASLLAVGGLVLSIGAAAQDTRAPARPMVDEERLLSRQDRLFVQQALRAGMEEVTLGRSALKRARSLDVKDFAEMMVSDHSKANNQLRTIAEHAGVRPVVPPDARVAREQLNTLRNLKGTEFDRRYLQMMVQDHEKAIALYERMAEDAKNLDLRQHAQETLPTLQRHLMAAQRVMGTLQPAPSAP